MTAEHRFHAGTASVPALSRRQWLVSLVALAASATGCATSRSALGPAEKRARMERVIRSFMGARYRLGGTARSGVDCSGLVLRVYEAVGVKLPHNAEAQYRMGSSVVFSGLQFGDVLFFNTKKLAARPCTFAMSWSCSTLELPLLYGVTHTGLYVGSGRFVHASSSRGVVRNPLEDDYWQSRLIAARRYLDEDLGED